MRRQLERPGSTAGASRESLAAFRSLLERYVPLTDARWAQFAALLRPRHLQRGAHLVRAGESVRTLSFVIEGVLRRYYAADRGEVTTGFLAEHSFATDYPALCSDMPSESNVQALTSTALLGIDIAGLQSLAHADAEWRSFAPMAGLALARRREHRQIELLTRSPEERYRDLVRQCPTLMDRVPHYHVASYLGITPESLSRLRRRLEADSSAPRPSVPGITEEPAHRRTRSPSGSDGNPRSR